jgi:hypothetical protein
VDNIKLKQLGAILLLAGLILMGFTLRAQSHLLETPQTTEGRVIDRFTVPTKNVSEPELLLRVEFTSDGSKQVIERSVEESFWNAHAKGSQVQLALRNADVSTAKVVGSTNEKLIFWIKLGGGAVALLLGLVVLAYDRWRV